MSEESYLSVPDSQWEDEFLKSARKVWRAAHPELVAKRGRRSEANIIWDVCFALEKEKLISNKSTQGEVVRQVTARLKDLETNRKQELSALESGRSPAPPFPGPGFQDDSQAEEQEPLTEEEIQSMADEMMEPLRAQSYVFSENTILKHIKIFRWLRWQFPRP